MSQEPEAAVEYSRDEVIRAAEHMAKCLLETGLIGMNTPYRTRDDRASDTDLIRKAHTLLECAKMLRESEGHRHD